MGRLGIKVSLERQPSRILLPCKLPQLLYSVYCRRLLKVPFLRLTYLNANDIVRCKTEPF